MSARPKRHEGAVHTNLSRATQRSSTARHLSTPKIGSVCKDLKVKLTIFRGLPSTHYPHSAILMIAMLYIECVLLLYSSNFGEEIILILF